MKKINWIIFAFIFLIIALLFVRFVIGGDEDAWIKDSKGVYVKHGNPSETPDYVLEQQKAIAQAQTFYIAAVNAGTEFSSQCLGSFGDYAFDIVHVPRTAEDNHIENQCEDYVQGRVSHFIELDKEGNIILVS